MTENLRIIAVILLSIALIDGFVDLIEWVGNFNIFNVAGIFGVVTLAFYYVLNMFRCKCKDNAIAEVIVAEADTRANCRR